MISKTDPCEVQQNIILINWERLTFSALDNKARKFIGCLSEVVDISSGWLVVQDSVLLYIGLLSWWPLFLI